MTAILTVKTESLPTRCEVCHQSDLFDPPTNFCSRCAGIIIASSSDYYFRRRRRSGRRTDVDTAPNIVTGSNSNGRVTPNLLSNLYGYIVFIIQLVCWFKEKYIESADEAEHKAKPSRMNSKSSAWAPTPIVTIEPGLDRSFWSQRDCAMRSSNNRRGGGRG